MNEQAIRFRIGIFVFAGLIALGVLIMLFGGRPFFSCRRLHTLSCLTMRKEFPPAAR